MQVALDEVAEHGAEAAAGSDAVEEALGQPYPLGRDRDREWTRVATSVGEVRGAEQRGHLGLVDGRCVEEPWIVGRSPQRTRLAGDVVDDRVERAGPEALDPAVPTDEHTGWSRRAPLGEASRGE